MNSRDAAQAERCQLHVSGLDVTHPQKGCLQWPISMSQSLFLQDRRAVYWLRDTMYDEGCEWADIQLMLY